MAVSESIFHVSFSAKLTMEYTVYSSYSHNNSPEFNDCISYCSFMNQSTCMFLFSDYLNVVNYGTVDPDNDFLVINPFRGLSHFWYSCNDIHSCVISSCHTEGETQEFELMLHRD